DVSLNTITFLAKQQQKMVVAVGTTTTRTLESLYWMGIKLLQSPEIKPDDFFLGQWECYEANNDDITLKEALSALTDWLRKNGLDRLIAPTSIMIAPGYRFRVVNALVTNFHQPGSTLILLVAAITGEEWKTIYNYALQNDFRFLSYGDGSLLFMQNNS
ncbi:MAG: S-adenosylmethionine:tRNA ribosyltransferase-isomerase, partial [Flavobacteriales bacterium]